MGAVAVTLFPPSTADHFALAATSLNVPPTITPISALTTLRSLKGVSGDARETGKGTKDAIAQSELGRVNRSAAEKEKTKRVLTLQECC